MTASVSKADVLVVGAGASGIPASIAAARAGAEVVLVEEDPVVGGATTDFYVDMLCGGPRMGVVKETEHILKQTHTLTPGGGRFFLPGSFLATFTSLLDREERIHVVAGARCTEVLLKDGSGRARVCGVRIKGAPGTSRTIESGVTIDATGTGAVAALAGCRVMYGRDCRTDFQEPHAPEERDEQVQQCTWMYISQQLGNGKPLDMMRLDHVKLGVLVDGMGWFHRDPEKALRLSPRIYLHWGCAVRCRDTRDPMAIAHAQAEALEVMEHDHALLRESGYAVYLAPKIGVRESARILGEHVVTENDLRSGVLPQDTIAVGTYGLDIWGEDLPGAESRTPAYGIPYRAIVPKDVDGLVLAGKAISGTHIAMSAYRVMPIVGSIGQGAGVAAALCAKTGAQPRDLDPEDVRVVLMGKPQGIALTVDR